MELFSFRNPTHASLMQQGEFVNDVKSLTWIERYRDAGEFTVTAWAGSLIREQLAIGKFVSHTNTPELMLVENHEITGGKGERSLLTVTGRSFESFYDNRVVGTNQSFPTSGAPVNVVMPVDKSWEQARKLIRNYTMAEWLVDSKNAIPYFELFTNIDGAGTSEERTINRGSLYAGLLSLLAVDDLGIKVLRPGAWSPSVDPANSAVVIHRGVDRSNQVVFSYDSGEVANADYLWSIKGEYNCALVSGKWVDELVSSNDAGLDRRVMYIDAKDIDDIYDESPQGYARVAVVLALRARGRQVLAAQKKTELVNAQLSKTIVSAVYRKDYDVGDIVSLSADYNTSAKMRVTEYVEINDETGSMGYPTLAKPEEGYVVTEPDNPIVVPPVYNNTSTGL